MQKLVFTNGNGKSIDLTGGNFGVTNWDGLSNTDLNIQTQQVPFNDGGVYLDALLEQREITVTVAIQDNNDLPTRYELRRELISALNPKAGEGVLVYTNDYLSRQIKAVPQLPIFENKNANDSGSLKASVTFSCPSPYWEDTEETVVPLKAFTNTVVENNGDVPCGVKIEIDNYSNSVFSVKNDTQSITLNNVEDCDKILINTNTGEKQVVKEGVDWEYIQSSLNYNLAKYYKDKFYLFSTGVFLTSETAKEWDMNTIDSTPVSIAYCENQNKYIAVAGRRYIFIYDSEFNRINLISTSASLYSVLAVNNNYIAVGSGGAILTSTDLTTWTPQTSGVSEVLQDVIFFNGVYVVIGTNGTILTSIDLTTWTPQTSGVSAKLNSICCTGNLCIIVGASGTILTSTDLTAWTAQTSGVSTELTRVKYISQIKKIIAVGYSGKILTSKDAITWTAQTSGVSIQLNDVVFSEKKGSVLAVGRRGTILQSYDCETWGIIYNGENTSSNCYAITYGKGMFIAGYSMGNALAKSPDGKTWERYATIFNSVNFIEYIKEKNIFFATGAYSGNFAIAKSEDAENWNIVYTGGQVINTLVYAPDNDVFIGLAWSDNYSFILKSTGGDTWAIAHTFSYKLNSICYSEEKQMYAGVGNNIITRSADGETWSASTTIGNNCNIRSIIYNEDESCFICCGTNTGTSKGFVAKSNDAITWTFLTESIPDNYAPSRMFYNESEKVYFALSNYGILSSLDWSQWVIQCTTNTVMSNMGINEQNTMVAVGNSEIILKSEVIPEVNIIDRLTSDSDMTLNLKSGENNLLLFNTPNNITGRVVYRPKYIGV